MNQDAFDEIALFRYQVIAPLLGLDPVWGRLKEAIRMLAARTYQIPYSDRSVIRYGTIEEWYYRYRHGGLSALRPMLRSDAGKSRKIDDALGSAIEEILNDRPALDGPALLKELLARKLVEPGQLSLNTLYRFRKARGLHRLHPPAHHDHRAFAFEFPGDCWQCDLMYGPALPTPDGRRRRTYLYAVLDDATRLAAHAQFYFDSHLSCLKDTLKQAFLKRGLPRKLYVDCGMIFRSRQLMLVAARLGIHIIHSRPYRPEGRAKIERWFGTVRRQFLARCDVDRLDGIEHLNRLLWAWVEGEYHQKEHRTLGQAPIKRWLKQAEHLRPLPSDVDLEWIFLDQAQRCVKKDGTFSLKGSTFEAGVHLIGQKITVRYDPFDLRRVYIVLDQDRRLEAYPVDLHANARVARLADSPEKGKPTGELVALQHLAEELDQQIQSPQGGKTHGGAKD